MNIRTALQELTSSIGGESPALDAGLLLAHCLCTDRERLYLEPERELTGTELQQARNAASRRSSGEPVAYITGYREFYGRRFAVDSRVLIPRPDTEILVDAVLQCYGESAQNSGEPINVLDLCCGSGCVGITLQAERARCMVTLSDIDNDALQVARHNAENLLPVSRRPEIICSDLFAAHHRRFHIIAINPPYVSEREYIDLNMNTWKEPRHALIADQDGLDIIRRIADTVVDYIYPNGYIAVEAADRQADQVAELLLNNGFDNVWHSKDLSGHRRVTVGRYRG